MSDQRKSAANAPDLAAYVLGRAEIKAKAIVDEARGRAADIEQEAFAQARRRLDAAKREERTRARELCRAAEARMHARIAGRRRALDVQRLDLLRRQFVSVLDQFWRTPALRDAWVRAAVARAKAAFDADDWTVELSGPAELCEAVCRLVPGNAEIVNMENGSPGLRVRCGGAVLDATAEGFLAQGTRLDALLLAALEEQAPGDEG